MLKCESRTSLHTVQNKWQPGSVLTLCSYVLWNSKPSFVYKNFIKIKAFVWIKNCSCKNKSGINVFFKSLFTVDKFSSNKTLIYIASKTL